MDLSPAPLRRRPSANRRTALRRLAALTLATAAIAAACVPASDDPGAPNANPAPGNPPAVRPGTGAPAGSFITPGERMGIGGCPLFPANNVFHADISTLPVAGNSDAVLDTIGRGLPVHNGFHASVYQNSRGGIPINIVDSRVTGFSNIQGQPTSRAEDLTGHPFPARRQDVRIEGHPGEAWDRHVILVDQATCISHEFFYAQWFPMVGWMTQSAAKIPLTNNNTRPRSAMASGFSLLHGMLRVDEVEAGRVDHALRITLPTISNQPAVWPATKTDGRSADPNAPRMGSWFRLRADADLSGLGPQAQTVARALQQHGAILVDTGSNYMTIGGENSNRWNDADLGGLDRFSVGDFEIVDPTPMQISPGSHEIR